MTPRDVFALIVRTAGLAFVICAIFDLLHLLSAAVGLLDQMGADQAALGAFDYGIVGAALLASTRPITRWVYGQGP